MSMLHQDSPEVVESRFRPLAFLWLCTALVAVSFAPIFIRFSETELGANATVFNRLLIYCLVFGFGRFIAQQLKPTPLENRVESSLKIHQWLLLGSVGVISIISLVLWAISLEYTTVAKSMLLNNLTPIFTSLGSWLFLGRRFDNKFLVGMAIALSGAITLGIEDLSSTDDSLIGDIYAVLSAVFLGSYFLVVEQLRSRFSATTILLWRCSVGSMLLIPMVFFFEDQFFPTTATTWLAVMGLGIISEGLGQGLLAQSMSEFSSSFISLFLLLEPIVSAILAWIIFVERLSASTWIGFAVVLSGIYLAQSSRVALQPSDAAITEVELVDISEAN